jgi:quinol monooxygenase YgiN
MSVSVVVNFYASEGKADELRPLLQRGRDISRRSLGCESFELFQRQDDLNKFVFLETWSSIEAHHQNMAEKIVASGHLEKILPLLAGLPDNGVLELI